MYDRFSNFIHRAYDTQYRYYVSFRNNQKYKKVTTQAKVTVTSL